MSEIVFFLEEPSAEAMLHGLLPRILPQGMAYRCVPFEGRQDLEKKLDHSIRGYRAPGARFVVLRDQDAGDCLPIKQRLVQLCEKAGRPATLVRIACRELESWYLADLAAVEKGMGVQGIAGLQNKRKYRSPDALGSPSQELAAIVPSYQKVGGSRMIGPHLDPDNTRSKSFAVFVNGVRRLCAESPSRTAPQQ